MSMDQSPEAVASTPAEPIKPIGRIVSVTGSQAVVLLDDNKKGPAKAGQSAELGMILTVETPKTVLLGVVSALSVPVPSQHDNETEVRIAELELVGELSKARDVFVRGVSIYPTLGENVFQATTPQLELAYLWNSPSAVRLGSLRQDQSIAAMIDVNELLGKHFAVLGSTGTGKSCGVALILRTILEKNPKGHILLLDPHNEYARSFGNSAEVITPKDRQLPFWFMTFEELVEVLMGDQSDRESEVEILSELILLAKASYAANRGRESSTVLRRRIDDFGGFTVDTPIPYRISDVVALIDERMGRLENRKDLTPYRQLKTRIETISQDPRYQFMFGNLTIQDHMAEILGRLFRVPVQGKPIAILELTGVPSEVVNVVVSVICRMSFDFALWSDGRIPLTLVCEEAHRYVPNDPVLGFDPTRRAIARIAKEGRKYGVSLAVISQRPAELDPTILSQCSTIFAMRLSNERDQEIVRAAISDSVASLLDFLPSMGTREAVVFGDGVTLPQRMRFDDLPEEVLPRSRTARFTEQWRGVEGDRAFLEDVVDRWRAAGAMAPISGAIPAEADVVAVEAVPEPERRQPQNNGAATKPGPAALTDALGPRD